jgi:peroxiredoxin
MAATSSTMLALGTRAPDFSLRNAVDDTVVSLSSLHDKPAVLVMFLCNHCPFVIHVRDQITRIAAEYMPKGLGVVAINANAIETHPQDGPPEMRKLAQQLGWRFPFLFDETQEVAKAYRAACTPDFFLFDRDRKLVYRGQLDDSRPGNGVPVTGRDLRAAIDAVLAGSAVSEIQKPSVGCGIKWRGEPPAYLR